MKTGGGQPHHPNHNSHPKDKGQKHEAAKKMTTRTYVHVRLYICASANTKITIRRHAHVQSAVCNVQTVQSAQCEECALSTALPRAQCARANSIAYGQGTLKREEAQSVNQ